MNKIIIIIAILSFIVMSCQKDADPKQVQYMITGLTDPYEVVYLDDMGASISETISPDGMGSEWIQPYSMEQGTPIYLYLKFKEDITSSMSFSMGILVNGKYEYQAKYFEKNSGDTLFEVKRSGVVPFD